MLKRLSVLLIAGLAVVALAATTITGAIGKGVAVNGDGHNAGFDFEVAKTVAGDGSVRYGGRFNFTTRVAPPNEPPAIIGVLIGLLRQFNKTGHAASFGGSGVISVQTATALHRYEGTVAVVVNDRHDPEHNTGDPDQITVIFTPRHDGPTFRWSGLVRNGDLHVFERVVQ